MKWKHIKTSLFPISVILFTCGKLHTFHVIYSYCLKTFNEDIKINLFTFCKCNYSLTICKHVYFKPFIITVTEKHAEKIEPMPTWQISMIRTIYFQSEYVQVLVTITTILICCTCDLY